MTLSVVLARYKEDVAWATGLTAPVHVYDKGPDPAPGHVPLVNAGREAHAYCTHAASHYEDLTDVVVFSQAHPFDHCPDFIEQVAALPNRRVNRYLDLCRRYEWVTPGRAWRENLMNWWFPQFMGRPMFNGGCWMGSGAIFAATRDAIRSLSRRWWDELAEFCLFNPYSAHMLEIFWPYVFHRDELAKADSYPALRAVHDHVATLTCRREP